MEHLQQPCISATDGPWGQPGTELLSPGAGRGAASPRCQPAKCHLYTSPQLSPFLFPAFLNLQPLPQASYCLLHPALEDIFSTPHLIPCIKTPYLPTLWWRVLLSPREQILISKFLKLFCLIILYFLSCLSWLLPYKSWCAAFKIYHNIQIVSICICMWSRLWGFLGKFALKT